MALIQRVDYFGAFYDAFIKSDRKDQFSYEGLKVLFEYFDDFEEDIELDVVGICCEWQEFQDIEEFNNQYDTEYESQEDITETTVLDINGDSFLIVQF